jgi:ribosome-binding protein aMBF1 (putative translation factor)
MTSGFSNSAKLLSMSEEETSESVEWHSPIGMTITESIEESERLDPEWAAERARNRHLREFAKLVLIRRCELELNQEALAKRMGTSHSVISRLESGRHSFSVATMLKVARAMDMKLVIGFEVDDSLESPGTTTRNLVVAD